MSCLFNSISKFLNLSGENVRSEICNYLEKDLPIIDGMKTSEVLNGECVRYVEGMRNSSTMGGAIEIQAACNIWNAKIIVYNTREPDGKKIEFIPVNNTADKCFYLTWSGGHYEEKM